MIISIQTIPARLELAKALQAVTGGTIYNDEQMRGPLWNFKRIIEAPGEGHRLNLQDDILLARSFMAYLPEVEAMMTQRGLHALSLYIPHRKEFEKYRARRGLLVSPVPLGPVAMVFSPGFVGRMRSHITEERTHDCVFIAEVLKATKQRMYGHMPGLVQHDADVPTSMPGHWARPSPYFDAGFIEGRLKP